jgi:tetratricopeptide (TPR) repeat protein
MRKGRIFTFLIILLLFLAPAVWSGGKKEDQLPLAEKLVGEKKYSDAINILADIVKNEPERLDHVEKLMAEIRSARNLYNDNYSELIQILKKETMTDADVTEAYNLITEMEKIDAAPDQAITGSFEKAKRTIVFRYNDALFEDIMNRALSLIDIGQYWEAVAVYLQAIGLHGDIFRQDYSEEVVADVDSVINNIKKDYSEILNLKNRYVTLRNNSFLSSKKEYYDNLYSEYADLNNIISEMAVIRENSLKNAVFFESEKDNLLEDG